MHIIMYKYREICIDIHIYSVYTYTYIFIYTRNKNAFLSHSVFLQQSNVISVSLPLTFSLK